MTLSTPYYFVFILSVLTKNSVLSFRPSFTASHVNKFDSRNIIMSSSTIQANKNMQSSLSSSSITSLSGASHKIKSLTPSWTVPMPSSSDRHKIKYLTPENRVNADVGIKVRTEYVKSRLLTEVEEMLAGRTSSMGKKLELVRKVLKKELNRDPSYEEWAAKCGITKPQLESYINASFQARNLLVLHNMRLVDYLVRGILESSSKATKSLSYFELVTEGIIGLTQAAENYDGRCRFATYSHFWIRSAIYKCISRLQPGSMVSHHTASLNNKLKKTSYAFKQEFNREPTDAELCKELKWTSSYLTIIRDRATKKITSAEKSFSSDQIKTGQHGLQQKVSQNYFDLDIVPPQSADTSNINNLIWSANFKTALNILEPHERRVLGLRYGFIDGMARTIPLTAELMCVSEESIRLTTIKALEKLKSYEPSNDILLNGKPDLAVSTLDSKITAKMY